MIDNNDINMDDDNEDSAKIIEETSNRDDEIASEDIS